MTHLYATRSRPAMFGTVPPGFKIESEEQTDLTPFGTISYEAPLDALTCWKYELRNLFEDYKVGDEVVWVEGGKVCAGKIFQIDDKWTIWADEYTKLPFWALHLIPVKEQPVKVNPPAKFEVVYDPLNKRYDLVVPLPSNRLVRKPILNGCIDVQQQQTILDVKHRDIAVRQLNDLIAYYQGLLAYVESK
jgi:hypothetical protein